MPGDLPETVSGLREMSHIGDYGNSADQVERLPRNP
jgi:hypothetical protein